MTQTLHEGVVGLTGVVLDSDARRVVLGVETAHGPMRISFDRNRVSATNPHQLLVLMLVTGLLMTVIAYVFLRNQLRPPIRRLARAAEAFGKGGRNEPYRLAGGANEVRSAGKAFLDMRARIERQMEQRTMMLSGVSHDLRTPLTRMRLELSLLEDAAAREALEKDVEDMERLVNEFLSFARSDALEGGAPEPVDPVALARDLAENAARAGLVVELGELAEVDEMPMRLCRSAAHWRTCWATRTAMARWRGCLW